VRAEAPLLMDEAGNLTQAKTDPGIVCFFIKENRLFFNLM
jgi:hypothetical protein